jgi:hypothetical protein
MRIPEKLIESKERAKLQKMTSRCGIFPDEKAKIREKAKNMMKRLIDSTEKLIKSKERARLQKLIETKERARLQKMTSRIGISPDEKAKIREKEKEHDEKSEG